MRLIIVSNRLPFTVSLKQGKPQFGASAGGLNTGLWSYLERASTRSAQPLDFVWVGWPGASIPTELQPEVAEYSAKFKTLPVFLPEERIDRFYQGFCNKTLWPLFHYRPSLTRYDEESWDEYKRVNQTFCDALLNVLSPDDVVWVHDYQLMLLPRLLRERWPEIPIGFFLHIPFPSFEVFRLLPVAWRSEIIEGLLGAGLIGFHTHDYCRHFLGCVLRTAGYEHQLGQLTPRDRVVKVDTFPMGIDFEKFAQAADWPETQERVSKLREKCAELKVIFSVDRLDYTKGLINRLRGYELFLKANPHWLGKVVFVLLVAPSRTGVESYQSMKQEIEQTVGRISGAYGTVQWTPLIYQYRNVSFEEIVALYRFSDIALITPLRDGMNLVAKEFLASRSDRTGVLILSEMAGASKELGEAIIINPFQCGEIAQALAQALEMPSADQVKRNQIMQERLRRYDVNRWGDEFIQALLATQKTEVAQRARSLTGKAQTALIQQYRGAKRRALLLDYDGTLVPFVGHPELAEPDAELVELLLALGADPANEVMIVSERRRADLEEWFGHLPVSLVAEHGVWLRPKGFDWRILRAIPTGWMTQVRPILQLYVDRLPGAILEEKEFSLAWHFRRADPEQASQRAKELLDDLADYTRNIDVQVLEGNKVIEVRNTGVTKGTAAVEWLAGHASDFVVAIGDDWTDEDLFRALPSGAYSIRIGLGNTAARYHVASYTTVRRLLRVFREPAPELPPWPGAENLSRNCALPAEA
ncbi:MAG: bifunctional alpha,alpha-trehalose-phosphate synthase (UDP-forming)/trehalose-phosphatase [Verrucomicrobiales bacterium]|nr:bifunctional alpha,alpha-trehalose-phosphate synthase (UDP-forming)/trehalose-phosphatase [Verrucomicrobiales bacterium]